MKLEKFYNIIQSSIDELGMQESVSLRSYSGRGMFGSVCLGMTVDDRRRGHEVMSLSINKMYQEDPDSGEAEDFVNAVLDTSTDSMGRGEIIYWEDIRIRGEDLPNDGELFPEDAV